MIHSFHTPTDGIALPKAFTFPFHYTPHPLTRLAADEVRQYLLTRDDWQEELRQGKMFGVLVIKDTEGKLGYLAAFSGNLAGSNHHAFFVPPVYDLLQPNGFFRIEEAEISGINHRIAAMEASEAYCSAREEWKKAEEEAQAMLASEKQKLKEAKTLREQRRKEGVSPEEAEAMSRESQFQKAEFKRLERRLKEKVQAAGEAFQALEQEIQALRHERKTRSAALQLRLFAQFCMLNARGEVKDLCEIFRSTPQKTPPAGAGECALPKLLQYAYLHQLQPLAMGEFWWGMSPKDEIRREGHFYPSCKGKCEPILKHMLVGLDVEPNPLEEDVHRQTALEILYEDFWWYTNRQACFPYRARMTSTPFSSACTTFTPRPPVRSSCTVWTWLPPACCSQPKRRRYTRNFRHFSKRVLSKSAIRPCWKENWKLTKASSTCPSVRTRWIVHARW